MYRWLIDGGYYSPRHTVYITVRSQGNGIKVLMNGVRAYVVTLMSLEFGAG